MSLHDFRLEGRAGYRRDEPAQVRVGLVNLMPDAAFVATESQFRDLILAASGPETVKLELFTLPQLGRTGKALVHAQGRYSPIEALFDLSLDGLIVTGTEPKQSNLRQEPYWRDLTRTIDWAAAHTTSSIFSCLAAHAAVLHLDGIERRRMPVKLTGVVACAKTFPHWATANSPDPWHIPHSRWNDLSEDGLIARGYQILTRSPQAGADMFARNCGSQFICLQGHPEYQADTLQREYRRDVHRYLAQESGAYPQLPVNVFDKVVSAELEAIAAAAASTRDPRLLEQVSRLTRSKPQQAPWAAPAVQFYRNWLQVLAAGARAAVTKPGVTLAP